ncbi:MAG: hypothetical protein ABW000_07310 [Actinoplanes sp.]
MSSWVEIATAIGALLTAAGGAAGLRALFRRRPVRRRVSEAVALSAGTIRWAEKLEAAADRAMQRAEAAERKADDADARADATERRAALIDTQLGQLASYLDMLLRAINDPGMDMARLRALAAEGPPHLARRDA